MAPCSAYHEKDSYAPHRWAMFTTRIVIIQVLPNAPPWEINIDGRHSEDCRLHQKDRTSFES